MDALPYARSTQVRSSVKRTLSDIAALPQATDVASRDGVALGRIFEQDRISIKLDSLPPHVIWAFVSAEDKRFFRHRGIDPVAMFRALVHNLRALRIVEGGSTITQQLVRNALVRDTRRTVWRKIKEILYAVRVERAYSKAEILEAYLNAIWYGHGMYGIRNASTFYFGVEPQCLDRSEAACLAGLVRAPGKLSPLRDPARAVRRRNYVLRQMCENGYLSSHSARSVALSALPVPSRCRAATKERVELVEYCMDCLRDEVRRCHPRLFPSRHLSVQAALDRGCQKAVARAVADFTGAWSRRKLAVLVTESHSGRVLGVANGSAYAPQQFNVTMRGKLQPGSTYKPFVLAAALKLGISPDSVYVSEPVSLRLGIDRPWEVRNYGDIYRGNVTLAQALVYSDNCVFARLAAEVGLPAICQVLDAVGLAPNRPTLAVSLGAVEGGVSPLRMAAAYSVFANRGHLVPPTFHDSVTDVETGRRIACPTPSREVLDPGICDEVDSILQTVAAEGTGRELRHFAELRAKTGTVDQGSWMISYDPFFLTTVWVPKETEQVRGILPAKARTAVDLTKRVREWLHNRHFLADFWGVLRGYSDMSEREKLRLSMHFVSGN